MMVTGGSVWTASLEAMATKRAPRLVVSSRTPSMVSVNISPEAVAMAGAVVAQAKTSNRKNKDTR